MRIKTAGIWLILIVLVSIAAQASRPKTLEIAATIDRVEENIAVLLIRPDEDVQIDWPMQALPDGVREGSIIQMSIWADETEADSIRARIHSMLRRYMP